MLLIPSPSYDLIETFLLDVRGLRSAFLAKIWKAVTQQRVWLEVNSQRQNADQWHIVGYLFLSFPKFASLRTLAIEPHVNFKPPLHPLPLIQLG